MSQVGPKKTRFQLTVGTFDPEVFRSGVESYRNSFCCSRTAKTGFRPKTGSGRYLSPKKCYDAKNFTIDATFCVDSKSGIRKSIAHRNLELYLNSWFSLLGSRKVFLSVGRRDINKLSSKMKSTYIKGLGNKVSALIELVALQTSGSKPFRAWKSKIRPPQILPKHRVFDV